MTIRGLGPEPEQLGRENFPDLEYHGLMLEYWAWVQEFREENGPVRWPAFHGVGRRALSVNKPKPS